MTDESICTVCGNVVDPLFTRCPYCKEKREPDYSLEPLEQFKIINLERGMPVVKEALQRLEIELEAARQNGYKVLILIHGYGSSGKGGAIRNEVRKQLLFWLGKKKIKDVLPGEKCGKRSGHARQLLRSFPFLKEFLLQSNPGISLIVI